PPAASETSEADAAPPTSGSGLPELRAPPSIGGTRRAASAGRNPYRNGSQRAVARGRPPGLPFPTLPSAHGSTSLPGAPPARSCRGGIPTAPPSTFPADAV